MFRTRDESHLFPTRLWSFELDVTDTFNAELAELILARSREMPSTTRGERTGGWQSDTSFFGWSPAAEALRHLSFCAVRSLHSSLAEIEGMHLRGWANLLGGGDCFSPHTHGGSSWSGVYWVDGGDSSPENGGLFAIRDPRAGASMVESPLSAFDNACAAELQPMAGKMIVFPSWLVHWVSPYRGTRPRISVSFNAV